MAAPTKAAPADPGLRSGLLALALLLAAPAFARNDAEAEAERKLAEIRARITELSAEQRALQDRRGAAERELREADQTVAEALRALRGTEAELAHRETELARLEHERAALSGRLDGQREGLAALLRSSYALGRHAPLKLLLAQDRIADLTRALGYHRVLQADRSARIEALMAELEALAEIGRRIEAERDALAVARLAQGENLAELEVQRERRQTLLAELDARQRAGAERLAALGRDERTLIELLERLRDVLADVPRELDDGKPFDRRRGALAWPLVGPLLTGYGGRLPDGRPAQGWLIAGTAGAEVRAISHGRVAFADWMKGYGLILILDHGEGWMSLYANNDALLRNPGDWVGAGEAVASVGSSGGQGRPALYFELRRDGKPVDPRAWLQRR